ncbi:conjugative relaxase [Salmonella enterica]|nr:conjugative relaxase [Salmonella enterica]
MLNITTITRQNTGKVVNYYADSKDDYYAKDGTAMQWQGNGAEQLGLKGDVDKDKFRELLEGRVDGISKARHVKTGSETKERLGYDLTFSAPKGVSLQALVHGDQRIIDAHDKAVSAALREAEMLAMGRSTQDKKTSIEHTDKLVMAKFRHETSRELDPELHTHGFVMNLTQTADGKWRALTNDGIINSLTHLGNVYKSELARELELAGYQLRHDKNGTFDLAHFSREQITGFSQRGQQVEAQLEKQGLSRETATHAQKSAAALMTRDEKQDVDRDKLHQSWVKRAGELGIDFENLSWNGLSKDDISRNSRPSPQVEKPLEFHADKAMQFAIKHTTERNSVVSEKELMNAAIKQGYGRLGIDDIRQARDRVIKSGGLIEEVPLYKAGSASKKADVAMSRQEWIDQLMASGKSRQTAQQIVDRGIDQGRLVKQEPRFTTQVAQERERNIIKMEREGRGTIQHSYTREVTDEFLKARSLKPEQRKAVDEILFTQNRYMAVHGFAGTGKSYMTKSAADALRSQGVHVTSLAPYGSQVKALQEEGLESRTLAAFLKAGDKKIGPGSVVFIDEAGVIPARQMQETMRVIKESGARAVFLGDTKQTKAVEAGKPLEQMINAGMQTSYMKDIQRQKNPELLKAALLAAEGHASKSLAHIPAIVQEADKHERHHRIVKDYAAMSAEDRAGSLIITGTNESRRAINAGIQKELGLTGTGQNYSLLNRLDTTQAQRQHSKYYTEGSFIIPERDYSNGLQRGKVYEVIDTGPGNRLTVKDEQCENISFSPARYSKLSVYSIEKTELAAGDQVRMTRNDAQLDVANGDRFTVKGVREDKVLLENDKGRLVTIDASKPMYMGLAYASTVHSAQGLTTDKVFINVDTKSLTTAKDVYYVAVTRARHEAIIYTDDAKKLGSAVSRESLKNAALEINQLRRYSRATPDKTAENQLQKDGSQLARQTQKPAKERSKDSMGMGK